MPVAVTLSNPPERGGSSGRARRLLGVIDRFRADVARARIADQASASAFWLFLALLPLAAVTGMVVAKVGIADVSVFETVLSAVPPSSRVFMREEFAKVAAWNGGAVAPLSVLTFFWLASAGVHAILDAFDVTTGSARPWWRKRALAIALCVSLSLVVGGFGVLVGFVERSSSGKAALSFLTAGPWSYAAGFLLETLLIVALFATGVARDKRLLRRACWPGAALAAATHTVLGVAYAESLRRLGDGGAYKAGLATIGITMSVVYFFTLSLLVGLTLSKVISESRAEAP